MALFLFKQLPLQKAVIWSVFLSFLFLPSSFSIDLPALPAMDKATLPNLVLLLMVAARVPLRPHKMPLSAALLSVAVVVGGVGTVMTNADSIWTAEGALPGLSAYDGLATLGRQALILTPFFVGWRVLSSVEAHRELLRVIVILGLLYSLLMLVEVRLSPQLHTWVYGYFPHSFAQQIRGGGFRPVVFFRHGLWNSFFAMTVVLAAGALYRDRSARPQSGRLDTPIALLAILGYMLGVVVLCKSLGSLIQSMMVAPILLFLRRTLVLWAALAMGVLAMSYPVLRGADIVPVAELVDSVAVVSEERAQSLEFRLNNEDILLERARQRPLFGWGSWGRNRVFDDRSGQDLSIVDGYWVIELGSGGWWGFFVIFGFLLIPIVHVVATLVGRARRPSWATVGLVLFIGVNMLELIPNSTLPPWTWLIAGSLLGWSQRSRAPLESRPA